MSDETLSNKYAIHTIRMMETFMLSHKKDYRRCKECNAIVRIHDEYDDEKGYLCKVCGDARTWREKG